MQLSRFRLPLLYFANRAFSPSHDRVRLTSQLTTFLFVSYAFIDAFHILLFGPGTVIATGEYLYDIRSIHCPGVGLADASGSARTEKEKDRDTGEVHSPIILAPGAGYKSDALPWYRVMIDAGRLCSIDECKIAAANRVPE